MMTLYLCVGESPPTVKELGPGWCSRYSRALRARRTLPRSASSLIGGPREPGDVPRPRGDVPRGEGGRREPGEGGRWLVVVVVVVGEGGRAALLRLLAAAAMVAVGEGGLRGAGVREPGGVDGERRGAGAGVAGGAPGDAPRFCRVLAPPASLSLGEGFLRGAPLDGDRCRLTRGDVGGVGRLLGGEGVTLVPGPRPPAPPPRATYRRGLTDRSRCTCLTGEDLGEERGEVFGEVLGESRWAARVLACARGSGEPGRRR